jgi:lipoate-protein ligase A
MKQVLVQAKASATHQMNVDRDLVMSPIEGPLLRFYDWDRFCVTVGIFSDVLQLFPHEDIEIARRPTGGGVLFHGHDMAFSFLFPATDRLYHLSTLEACREINAMVMQGLSTWLPKVACRDTTLATGRSLFCMSQATEFDIVWQGRKIGGAAQRKTKYGLLHQTSLFLQNPHWGLVELLLRQKEEAETMKKTICSLEDLLGKDIQRRDLQEAIGTSFLERI